MTTPYFSSTLVPEKHLPHGLQKSEQPFPKLATHQAVVQEIFSSIQGEGLYAGARQVFIRLAHCHLHCAYCDTPMTTPRGDCLVETEPASNHWVPVPGIQNVDETELLIAGLIAKAPHHSVSFTGGEPLLYPHYLGALMQRVQALGVKTYLETSGTQPHSLAKVLPFLDVLSMDVKFPSTTRQAARWQQHSDFYLTAQQAPQVELYVKCVVNDATTFEELDQLAQVVPDPTVPIYLQPETSLTDSGVLRIGPMHLLALQAYASQYFQSVRVLPQTHKMMKIA